MLVLWRKPLNVATADYVQIPWVWPRGVLPKPQKRSNAPHAGHAFATNPLLSPWVARGLPGGRPLGMAADTRIKADFNRTILSFALRRSVAFSCSLTVSGLVKSKMRLTIRRVTIKENVIFYCFDSSSYHWEHFCSMKCPQV